jgi:hypothetical protein
MGEKEIKPASAAGGDLGGLKIMKDPNEPPPPPAGGGRTAEPPRTGERPQYPPGDPRRQGGGREPKSASTLYPDGYRWGKDEGGDDYLINPDGSKASWDPTSETWKGADDGMPMPEDWSGGHRPPKYALRVGDSRGRGH